MDKIYLNSEEYEATVAEVRDRNGYDDMSDEEKEAFDARLDQAVGLKDDETDQTDETEETEGASDEDRFRDEMEKKFGYDDMSDEQKQKFDESYDQVMGKGESDTEDPDDPEKVLRKTR